MAHGSAFCRCLSSQLRRINFSLPCGPFGGGRIPVTHPEAGLGAAGWHVHGPWLEALPLWGALRLEKNRPVWKPKFVSVQSTKIIYFYGKKYS